MLSATMSSSNSTKQPTYGSRQTVQGKVSATNNGQSGSLSKPADCKRSTRRQSAMNSAFSWDVYFDRNLSGFSEEAMTRAKSAQLKMDHYYKVAVDSAIERNTRCVILEQSIFDLLWFWLFLYNIYLYQASWAWKTPAIGNDDVWRTQEQATPTTWKERIHLPTAQEDEIRFRWLSNGQSYWERCLWWGMWYHILTGTGYQPCCRLGWSRK